MESFHSCKWSWCRLTFSDNTALARHVVHEHVRRAMPVRRKDIPVIRRAEEGAGESLRMSGIMADPSSSSSTKDTSLSTNASSLPSPPASSPASYSPGSHPSFLSPPNQQGSFASLASPSGSPAPLAVPDSPSFSSLVHIHKKRKLDFDTSEEPPRKQTAAQHPLSLSHISSGSQRSVEEQLTQYPPSEDEDEDSSTDSSSDEDVVDQSSDPAAPSIPAASGSEKDLYKAELAWDPSQPEVSQKSNSTSEGQLQGSMPELLTQPPSQFQHPTFPFHHHGPKATSTELHPIQTNLDSSASLPLSSPAAISSPGFAVSTPRQSWYQLPAVRRRSSKVLSQPVSTESSPKKPSPPPLPSKQSTSRRSSSPKKTIFRSGTLQITPSQLSPEPIAEENEDSLFRDIIAVREGVYDPWANSQSQSYMDSQSSSQEIMYPPLQTQAPYQSQSLSELD